MEEAYEFGKSVGKEFKMKKIRKLTQTVLVLAGLIVCLTACGGQEKDMPAEEDRTETVTALKEELQENAVGSDGADEEADLPENDGKNNVDDGGSRVLVAYFSATGTTKRLAEYAAEIMGADLYEIIPEEPYTAADLDYNDKNSRTSIEMNDASIKPAINGSVSDMAQYDIVFLAYAGGIIGLN